MNLADLIARIRRLDQLARGLAKEVTLWKECNDPLLYLERKAYLTALQNGLAGLDDPIDKYLPELRVQREKIALDRRRAAIAAYRFGPVVLPRTARPQSVADGRAATMSFGSTASALLRLNKD